MNKNKLKDIAILSFFICISVILTRYGSLRFSFFGVEVTRFGFGSLPIVLSGILFGPIQGFIVGVLSDILGFFISPMGTYMPHFTLTSSLNGLIPGLVVHYFIKTKILKSISYKKLVFSGILISQILINLLLVPYFLNIIFKIPWKVLMIPRLITTPIFIVFYYYFVIYLLKIPLFSKYKTTPA
jgi:riboflavin transporter